MAVLSKVSVLAPEHVLLFVPAAIVLWYAVTALYSWYRIRTVPGPFLAKFSYAWLGRIATTPTQEVIYRGINKQYGPLVRVGPNELLTDDPELLRRMGAARSGYGKGSWYISGRWNPHQDVMFTTTDDKVHDRMKAKLAAGYSGRDVEGLEDCVDEQIDRFVDLLATKYVEKEGDVLPRPPLDLANATAYLTVDIITKTLFGKEFGYLKTDADTYGFLAQLRGHFGLLAILLDVAWLRSIAFSKTVLSLVGPTAADEKGLGRMMGVAAQHMYGRFQPDSKPQKDILGSFIRHGMTQSECEAEGLFALVAGSETTASVIRVTMLCLMSSPPIYYKFKEMIREAVASGAVSSPITVAEARKLPYLQAVIYEGLRIRSPATGLYPKKVPAGGDVILGHYVPGGTSIGMNLPSLLKKQDIFGADADVFRPERFLEADPETRTRMEREVEMVFGHGRYMCGGKPIAFMELYKVFFEMLRHFDFQIINPQKPWKSRSYNIFVEEDYFVKIMKSQ